MKKQTKEMMKKIGAGLVAGMVIGSGAGFLGGSLLTQPEVIVEERIVPVDVMVEVPVEIEVEKIVEKEVIVEVMDEKAPHYQQYLEQTVDEDIDFEYVQAAVEGIFESETFIREHIGELLDDIDAFDNGEALEDFHDEDVYIKSIADPIIVSEDYDSHDLELLYQVKVKAKDGSDYKVVDYNITAKVESGKLVEDEIDVILA